MVEGFFQRLKNPSTTLRAVPLPRSGGGIHHAVARIRLSPAYSSSAKPSTATA